MKNKSQNGFASIVLVVALVVVFGAAGYFVWQRQAMPVQETEMEIKTEQEVAEVVVEENDSETAGWKIYRNEEIGFEFKYPDFYKLDDNEIETQNRFSGLQISNKDFKFNVRINKEVSNYTWYGVNSSYKYYKDTKEFRDDFKNIVRPSPAFHDSYEVYVHKDGDAGAFTNDYLVPNFDENYWVIFNLSYDGNSIDIFGLHDEFNDFEKNFRRAVSSLKFL